MSHALFDQKKTAHTVNIDCWSVFEMPSQLTFRLRVNNTPHYISNAFLVLLTEFEPEVFAKGDATEFATKHYKALSHNIEI